MQHRRTKAGLLKSALLGAAALGAISLAGAGVAQAGPAFTGVQFSVWTGAYNSSTNGVSDQASFGNVPSRTADATFTYTGPIDFNNTAAQGSVNGTNSNNTFNNFFNSFNGTNTTTTDSSGIGNFVSSPYGNGPTGITTFLSTIMSTIGETGSAINTLIDVTGFYSGGAQTVSVTHDDGAVLAINGTTWTNVPGPNAVSTQSASLSAMSFAPFDLVYVESNGSPATLQVTFSGNGTVVPEPGSLALLGTGLLGLGLVARRRRRKA